MERLLALGWLLAVFVTGCRCGSADPAPADVAPSTPAPCTPRTGEHLGIPFVKLCPADLAPIPVEFEPFWIASQQLGCSAGEHDTLSCPTVTALQHPAPNETRVPGNARAALAAVTEAGVAQTVCYMRFGGRLPTREERARAEQAFGLASVMVSMVSGAHDAPPRFELIRLAEWVTEAPCTKANAAGCEPGMYPQDSRVAIPWDSLVACQGSPVRAGALLAVGEACPAPDFAFDAGKRVLPCGVRSPAARSNIAGFSLSCLPPEPARKHPEDRISSTAAFRCVLPGTARLPEPGSN